MSRVDRITPTSKQIIRFADFSTGFEMNPSTGLLAMKTNEEAVKQRIRNLVLTLMGSRPYHPLVGCKASGVLFDLNTDITADLLESTIRQTIENDEPAATLENIRVDYSPDSNMVGVSIQFSIHAVPNQVFDLTLNLVRVR